MQLLLSEMMHFNLAATDNDDIGQPKDFLLDDQYWAVRYLVLKAHQWIPLSKKVLLTPVSLGLPNTDKHVIPVNLTHDNIKDGPLLDDHLPVSRANEIELFHHYGYAYYWMGPGLWGTYPHPGALVDQDDLDLQKQAGPHTEEEMGNDKGGHLRSYKELIDYSVKVNDVDVGDVKDFVMDDTSWSLEYAVVKSKDKEGKHFRLIPMHAIKNVDWAERAVHIVMSRDQFDHLREYESQEALEAETLSA